MSSDAEPEPTKWVTEPPERIDDTMSNVTKEGDRPAENTSNPNRLRESR